MNHCKQVLRIQKRVQLVHKLNQDPPNTHTHTLLSLDLQAEAKRLGEPLNCSLTLSGEVHSQCKLGMENLQNWTALKPKPIQSHQSSAEASSLSIGNGPQ